MIAWIISAVAMMYTYYLSALLMAAQGLHALLYLRKEQRWKAIGSLALSTALFVPWAVTGFLQQLASPNPLFMPIQLDRDVWLWLRGEYFGQQWALLILIMLFGAVIIRYGGERDFSVRWLPDGPAFLMLCWVIFPFALIAVVNLFHPFVSPRWPFMITPAIVVLTARGLGNMRQPTRGLVLAALVLYGVTTVDSYRPKPPWDKLADHVATYVEPGDVVLMEANNGDYSLGYYFEHGLPEGVPFRSLPKWREVTDPATYHVELTSLLADTSTVWLVAWGDNHDVFNQLANYDFQRTWQTSEPFSDVRLDVMRFDKAPERTLAEFSNGMILERARFVADMGRIDLWWSSAQTLDQDFSVSAFVLDEQGALVAQHDDFPANNSRPTTSWQPAMLVFDPHQLELPELAPGRYTVGVKLYTWQDGQVYPTIDGSEWFTVDTFESSD